jgi:hypothetical protein
MEVWGAWEKVKKVDEEGLSRMGEVMGEVRGEKES